MSSQVSDQQPVLRETAQRIFEKIYAFYDVKVLAVALSLGAFEALRDGPLSADDLASRVKSSPRGIRSLLLGLSTLGLVSFESDRYGLTEAGRTFFLKDSAQYMGGAVEFADWQFDALPRLVDAVKDDKIVWEGFGHYIEGVQGVESEASRTRQARFNEGLAAGARGTAKAVMAKVDLSGSKRLLDVGGNLGVFAATILHQVPSMNATVFDLPQVAEQVNRGAEALGVAGRLDARGGDFTKDTLPTGYDLISFIRIFNSRTEETCLSLLKSAFDALPSKGRCLFYEEHVLPEDPNAFPAGALWGAMFMLISSPGELRTVSRWEALFREAGFVEVKGIRGKQSGIVIGEKP